MERIKRIQRKRTKRSLMSKYNFHTYLYCVMHAIKIDQKKISINFDCTLSINSRTNGKHA